MLEATCSKCGETFNPSDVQDIIHQIREDGSHCGGTGQIEGEYFRWSNNPVIWINLSEPFPPRPGLLLGHLLGMGCQNPPPTYDDMEAQAAYDDFWGRY